VCVFVLSESVWRCAREGEGKGGCVYACRWAGTWVCIYVFTRIVYQSQRPHTGCKMAVRTLTYEPACTNLQPQLDLKHASQTFSHVYAYALTRTRIYTHKNTHTHMHVRTYTHAHTHVSARAFYLVVRLGRLSTTH